MYNLNVDSFKPIVIFLTSAVTINIIILSTGV